MGVGLIRRFYHDFLIKKCDKKIKENMINKKVANFLKILEKIYNLKGFES